MNPSRLRVSDHAVLRYLERVGGFDVERLREEIAHRCRPAAEAGATGVVIDGYSYRIETDEVGLPVVVTVIRADGNRTHILPKRARR
jgi:hypothetical protein